MEPTQSAAAVVDDAYIAVATKSPHKVYARQPLDRSKIPILLAVALIALVFVPVALLGLTALALLGYSIVRSAVRYREEGWVSGVLLGLMFLVPAVAAICFIAVGYGRN